jgi:hypothetical protein
MVIGLIQKILRGIFGVRKTHICLRANVIKSCFAKVDDLISNGSGAIGYDPNAPKPSTADWEVWKLMASRIKRSGPDFKTNHNLMCRVIVTMYIDKPLKREDLSCKFSFNFHVLYIRLQGSCLPSKRLFSHQYAF